MKMKKMKLYLKVD